MGSSASSSGAPGGYPPPPANGTTLEAALAQIEEEQLQKALAESRAASARDSPDAPRPLPARPRPPPGGAVELGVVESDEAMAQRLQREERERANASSRDAFYPNMPYDPARRAPPSTAANDPVQPSFLAPVPHPAPTPAFSFPRPPGPPPPPSPPPPTTESLGRRAMNDEIALNTGKSQGTWTAPVLRDGSYPEPSRGAREPPSPYYPLDRNPPGTDSGWGDRPRHAVDPIGAAASGANGGGGSAEDDEALARALQAREEEEARRRARAGAGVGDGDAALAARLQAEEDAAAAAAGASSAGPRAGDVVDDDEALARALQEEEDRGVTGVTGGGSTGGSNRHRRTPADSVPPGACPGCRTQVSAFGGYVTAMGARWHRGCFTCGACGGAIGGGTSFATRDGAPYHRSCYREKFAPRCGVCDEFIGSSTGGTNEVGGSVRFMTHPYWGTVFCPEHEFDGTRRCDGCDRMEARGGRGVATGGYGSHTNPKPNPNPNHSSSGEFAELPDGRAMCLECASTAVIDADHDGAPLYDDVCVFFSKRDLPLLPERPPLHLVSQDTLNDADDKEGWHRGRTARTRGLCLFEEHTVYTVERTPDFAGGFFPLGFKERVVGQSRGATVVNAVVVLYGLPAVCAGAILAHECTHAYIRMAGGYPRLRPKVEEGLCQLMALLWVEHVAAHGIETMGVGGGNKDKVRSGGAGWEEHNLAAMAGFVANQIRTDPTEVYGDGLRDALAAYQKHGLGAVFEHVRRTGELPR